MLWASLLPNKPNRVGVGMVTKDTYIEAWFHLGFHNHFFTCFMDNYSEAWFHLASCQPDRGSVAVHCEEEHTRRSTQVDLCCLNC